MKSFLLTLIAVLTILFTNAQDEKWDYHFFHNSQVSAIAEEGEYLWLAVDMGTLIKMHKVTGEKSFFYINNITGYDYIYTICIDKSGNKWMGTNRHLIKFDNKDWKIYSQEDLGIEQGSYNYLGSISIDKYGHIWVGTGNGVLELSENGDVLNSYKGLWHNFEAARALVIDDDNNIWIAGEHCLGKFDGNEWINLIPQLPSGYYHIHTMIINNENIWIGNVAGSNLIKYDGNNFININNEIECVPELISEIESIAEEDDGTLWIGGYCNVLKISGENCEKYDLKDLIGYDDYFIYNILVDSEGNKWATVNNASGNSGNLIKIVGDEFIDYDLRNSTLCGNNIKSIFIDDNDNKWVLSTFYNTAIYSQISKFDNKEWTTINIPKEFELKGRDYEYDSIYDCITTMAVKDTNIWMGTRKGLLFYNGEQWIMYNTENSGLPDNYINEIAVESEIKWIGTNSGLVKFYNGEWIVYNYDNSPLPSSEILNIFITSDGTKWIGTGAGLVKIKNDEWNVYTITGLPTIKDISIDSHGVLWVLASDNSNWTVHDLFSFNGEEFVRISYPNDDKSLFATSLAIDNEDNKWIGEYYYGMLKIDSLGTFTHYSKDNSNIAASWINTIAIDKYNNKWIGGMYSSYGARGIGITVFNEEKVIYSKEEPFLAEYEKINVYPNPVNDYIGILVEEGNNILSVDIFSVRGQLLYKQNVNTNNLNLNISFLSSGVYFVKVTTDDGFEFKKILKH